MADLGEADLVVARDVAQCRHQGRRIGDRGQSVVRIVGVGRCVAIAVGDGVSVTVTVITEFRLLSP